MNQKFKEWRNGVAKRLDEARKAVSRSTGDQELIDAVRALCSATDGLLELADPGDRQLLDRLVNPLVPVTVSTRVDTDELRRCLVAAEPIDELDFVECAACAAKTGSPVLCAPCQRNRAAIAKANAFLRAVRDWQQIVGEWEAEADHLAKESDLIARALGVDTSADYDLVQQARRLREEIESWRGGARAIGIEGTADPRATLVGLQRGWEQEVTGARLAAATSTLRWVRARWKSVTFMGRRDLGRVLLDAMDLLRDDPEKVLDFDDAAEGGE